MARRRAAPPRPHQGRAGRRVHGRRGGADRRDHGAAPVAAVVSLSGETDPTSLVGGIPLNGGAAVKQLTVATMLVVATNDRSRWPSLSR
jgi:hypothetical protein